MDGPPRLLQGYPQISSGPKAVMDCPHIPQTVLALRGSGGFKGWLKVAASDRLGAHGKSLKNNEFLSFFKKNGAGARVLRSPLSVFDECFS